MTPKTLLNHVFSSPSAIFGLIAAISFSCLATAFIAEAVLLLEPCKLCIYQRYPYGIAILIGILGLIYKKDILISRILLGICAILYLTNSGIAVYHTGVEQRWWISAVEGCTVNFETLDHGKQSMLDNIMSAPTGSCEDIPWSDPVLGLSMANYNIVLCFILALYSLVAAIRIRTNLKA